MHHLFRSVPVVSMDATCGDVLTLLREQRFDYTDAIVVVDERVASLAIRNALGTVPVVDARGHLIGLIPPQATLAVLRHEHVEDLHRFTGILRENAMARAAIEGPPTHRAQHRLPWLLVGLGHSSGWVSTPRTGADRSPL